MCVFGCDAYHTLFFAYRATKKQTQINIADLGYVFATRKNQTAASSRSPVRMRIACSILDTKILPSPILPE